MNLTPPNLTLATPPMAPAANSQDNRSEDIRKAAEGFESLFIATLLKGARAGLPGDELTGGSAVNSSTQMLDAHLARVVGSHSGFGIAEAVARQFGGKEAGS